MNTPARLVVNVWDLIGDPEVPSDVVQGFFSRQRAKAAGREVPDVPAADLPHLARHAREVADA